MYSFCKFVADNQSVKVMPKHNAGLTLSYYFLE